MTSQENGPRSVVFLPGGEPPMDYSLNQEVEGVLRFAESNALARFDLLGYSGRGAVALAIPSP